MNEALASFSNLPLSADKEQFEDFFWEYGTPVWDYAGLRDVVMEQVRNGKMPEFNMIGASGNLKFAPDSYTSLVKSTYINWIIRDGRPVALDFIDERGIKYSSYVGAWDWKTLFDELENNALSAEKKYNNLNVEFTGTLETIDSDGEYISVIDLYDDSWGFDSIHCSIENDEQLNVIMTKSKGDEVFVQGEITEVGEIMGYTLTMHTIK
jgi:hypothetical protein